MIHPVKMEAIAVLLIGVPVLTGGKENIVNKVPTKQPSLNVLHI